jgi:hypothetical protein
MRSRPSIAAALVLVIALAVALAGCGDDDSALPTATTTTTTGAPSTTASPTTTADAVTSTTSTTDSIPLPQTTPNVSQPADSLLDGTHVVYLVAVDVPERSIEFDLVQWFYRDDFPQAISDGRLSADAECLDFDYCIVNNDQRTRTMTVADDARVTVIDYDDCCTFRRTDDLADAKQRLDESRDIFLLTAQDGELVAVDELYLS